MALFYTYPDYTPKGFEQKPIELAVRAHIRHRHTNYDELLMMGWDRSDARQEIIDKVEQVIEQWQMMCSSQ